MEVLEEGGPHSGERAPLTERSRQAAEAEHRSEGVKRGWSPRWQRAVRRESLWQVVPQHQSVMVGPVAAVTGAAVAAHILRKEPWVVGEVVVVLRPLMGCSQVRIQDDLEFLLTFGTRI